MATDKPWGVPYLSLLLEGADKIKLFVTGPHNGCLTYVNVPTVSSKLSREGKAGGVAVTGSRQAGMSLGQPSER